MDRRQVVDNLLSSSLRAANFSYSPYSGYKVGCSVESASGGIYFGANVENCSYSLTLCAERCAIVQMLMSEPMAKIERLCVVATDSSMHPRGEYCYPCGACLQFMSEVLLWSVIISFLTMNP
jgi:cytidine deaminase